MGLALIVDGGVATVAAGPVLTPVVAGQGSSFTTRAAALTSKIALVDAWRQSAHKGYVQINSPKLVPVSNGIRIQTPTGLADFLLPRSPLQALKPQDNLSVQDDGTAADVDLVCVQTWYSDLPGVDQQLKMPGDYTGATEWVFGWPVNAAAPATPGDQKGTVITNLVDSSDANRWYAVMGYIVDGAVGAVGISGVDTSQTFVGGPGDVDPRFTRNYFQDLSLETGMPCVPLFNAANKANTNVVLIDHAANTAADVTLILAELSANYTP